MIRHIALIKFNADVTPADIDRLDAGLAALPGKIPVIKAYAFGRDLRITDGTWDYTIAADFEDVDAFRAYQTHPDHVDLLVSVSQPMTAQIGRIQYELPAT